MPNEIPSEITTQRPLTAFGHMLARATQVIRKGDNLVCIKNPDGAQRDVEINAKKFIEQIMLLNDLPG